MIPVGPATRIFVALGATDMRKSFEGLTDLVSHRFNEDPLSGHLFVFCNRSKNRIKILYWDGTGLWVFAKRLPKGCFSWPQAEEENQARLQIMSEELTLLLSGIDLEKTRERKWWRKAA